MKRILIVTGFALAMAGCKVQNDVTPDAPYTGAVQVAFNNYQDDDGNYGYVNKDLTIKDSVFNFPIEIKLSNTTGAAGEDIKVYLAKADGVVGDYNTAHGTTMTPLTTISAAAQYDLTQPVVIKKGTRRGSFNLAINPSRLNASLQNAIGFRIVRAEGAEVSQGDQSTLVVNFNTRNSWDGQYQVFSRVDDPNRPQISNALIGVSPLPPFAVNCVTVRGNAVQMHWINFAPAVIGHVAPLTAGGWTQYANAIPTFNFDVNSNLFTSVSNEAPVLAPQNRSFALNTSWSATSNRRFPNKTIVVRYQMLQAGFSPVNIFDSLVYLGPR
jgi:hypothetical protein